MEINLLEWDEYPAFLLFDTAGQGAAGSPQTVLREGDLPVRLGFGILFLALIAALAVCARIAARSGKAMGKPASILMSCLILPMAGNGIIILSADRLLSLVGCYLYYLGLDLSIAALLHFTFAYCRITWPNKAVRNLVYGLFLVDCVQLLLNPLTGHAFEITAVEVDGYPYYRMIPHLGQNFHRAVDYLLLAAIIVIFVVRLLRAPRLQSERYSVILLTLIVVTLWETAYIFSGAPIDRSMIGFGVFGLMIFYFSLYHRPMRLLDRLLGTIVSQQSAATYCFDENQRSIWMNKAGRELLNLGEEDADKAREGLIGLFGEKHTGELSWKDQVTLAAPDGVRYYSREKKPVLDAGKRLNGYYVTVRDETEDRRALEEKLYEARHDRLTGLYNRDYLYGRVREILLENPDEPYLIAYADISDFRLINDVFGSSFGDLVLRKVAEWIRNNVPAGSAFGRLGGDTFGVCFPEKDFSLEWFEQELADFVVRESETEHHLLIHVGLYRIEDREAEVPSMFDRAHLALDSIKDEYHIVTAWYDHTMRERVLWNRRVSDELKGALEEGQLRPWLQPIVDRDGRVVGAEALVRWIHPEEGIRPPYSFIPVFEKNGMVADVDRSIWRSACEILARWQREEDPARKDLFLSVNISPKDFHLLDVAGELKNLVREYGIPPAKLRVEITETVMMTDQDKRMDILQDLQASGFCVEMDDFGSGYSSLNMLREMPVDVLKIDMAFLRKSGETPRARTILRQVISLAGELGITSLTEGVETKEQFEELVQMGCELYQGYYFARPMPVDEFERFCSPR